MTDILGTGISYNIKGKSGYSYEGILYDKKTRSAKFGPGKHYLMDAIKYDNNEVTDYKTVAIFENEDIPEEKLSGDKFFILNNTPRFGRKLTSDDFPL